MPNPTRHPRIFKLLIAGILSAASLRAAEPPGNYIFSGNGVLLLSFDGAGAFSGLAAVPVYGVVNMSGVGGTYVFNDRNTGAQLVSGPVSITAVSGGYRMTLGTSPKQVFMGTLRTTKELAPAGLFQAPFPPVAVLY